MKRLLIPLAASLLAIFAPSASLSAATSKLCTIQSEDDFVFRTGQDVVIMDLTDNSFSLQ